MVSVLEEAKRALVVLINALAVVYAVRVNITRDSEDAKNNQAPLPMRAGHATYCTRNLQDPHPTPPPHPHF